MSDGTVLDMIWKTLKAGYMEDEIRYETASGTQQGGVISPLLANIYLNELDWELAKANLEFVRYADYTEVETMPKLSLKHRRYQGFLLIISAYFFYYKRYRRSKVSGLLQLFIPLSGLTVSIAFARTSNVANA